MATFPLAHRPFKGEVSSVRGFPPTVAYVVIDQIPGGNNPPKGLLKYEWEVE